MDDTEIIATFVIIDSVLRRLGHRDHCLAQTTDAEVLLVAVLAARYFQNHPERALSVCKALHYLSGPLSLSRFNRRLHRLAAWLPLLAEVLGQVLQQRPCLIIGSLPVPVCRRVRARRCRTMRGATYWGYCAAKAERFFGWRLHLGGKPSGLPVRYSLLPAAYHGSTPIHELLSELPVGVWVLGDKAYNSATDETSLWRDTGVVLVPIRRANITPNSWPERACLAAYRHNVEMVNSQAEKMGLERLHVRTTPGLEIRVAASVIAVVFCNLHKLADEETGLPLLWAA